MRTFRWIFYFIVLALLAVPQISMYVVSDTELNPSLLLPVFILWAIGMSMIVLSVLQRLFMKSLLSTVLFTMASLFVLSALPVFMNDGLYSMTCPPCFNAIGASVVYGGIIAISSGIVTWIGGLVIRKKNLVDALISPVQQNVNG